MLVDDLLKRPTSSLLRALNDGKPGWSPGDHLLADLWQLQVQVHSKDRASAPDHPVRAAMEARARRAAKNARRAELLAEFNRRKNKYRRGRTT